MKIKNATVKELLRHYQEISLVGKTKAVLDWDLNVNLPPKASEGRARQSAYLANLSTKLWLDEDFKKNIKKASGIEKLTEEEQGIVRNLVRSGKYYFSVPREIIVEKEELSSKAFMAWKEAKEKNDFSIFLPLLKELIRVDQIIASHLQYKKNPYDALLDQFEPALTAEKARSAFDAIKPDLLSLTKRIQKSKTYSDSSEYIDGVKSYPESEQKRLALFVMRKMGFDFQAGRLDVSPHPFTTGLDRYDIRLTTFYHDHDFKDSYTSTMHETGHALYEQGIEGEYADTPLEGGVSYGIHEALSRFWENMVGKSPAFLSFMTPIFQSFYPEQMGTIDERSLARTVNLVKPSFVRIMADEVTYSLHIILRFEIENDLFNGKLDPKDAPEVWNEKSKKYFGDEPPTDRDGVLQDVHWSYGAFGYFPSYALGNLYGAQLLKKMKKEIPFDKTIREGNLLPVKGWLDQNVHRYGSLHLPDDLMKIVTGESLNPKYFVEYLTEKYTVLYDLPVEKNTKKK
jgi:carboxypeptidase Taq